MQHMFNMQISCYSLSIVMQIQTSNHDEKPQSVALNVLCASGQRRLYTKPNPDSKTVNLTLTT